MRAAQRKASVTSSIPPGQPVTTLKGLMGVAYQPDGVDLCADVGAKVRV